MNHEELNYNLAKIRQQIETLERYIAESPVHQQQAIEKLQAIATSVENLESIAEEMQTNLEFLKNFEGELLQQNRKITAERQVYHDLFKFAPNGYLVTNSQGIILEVNYNAGALLNVLPSLLIGKSLINFVSPEDRSFLLSKMERSLNVKSVQEIEVSICPRGREAFAALLLVKAGRETSGTLGALQISVHNIAKYKQSLQPLQLTPSQQTVQRLDGLRVLFVDDEADTRELIAAILIQHGVEVKTVTSVAQALEELERSRPDVIISDIRMPDEDGYVLIRKIKALEAQKGWQIPTAALSAYLAEDRAKAITAGFQWHLHKLAQPQELIAMVAQLAGRS